MNAQRGFSVVELMATVALLAILLGIGVPSFVTMVQNNRLVSQINEFVTSLHLARSEAIKRNVDVGLCASSDGTACDGANWEEGWVVFADVNNDDDLDEADGDVIIAITEAIDATGNTLRGSAGIASTFFYEPTGAGSDSGIFVLCDERGADHGRAVIVSATGRPSSSGTEADGSALDCRN